MTIAMPATRVEMLMSELVTKSKSKTNLSMYLNSANTKKKYEKAYNRIDKGLDSFKIIFSSFSRKKSIIEEIIKESEFILTLEDNWDDEWAKWFSEDLWNKSVSIIKTIYSKLPWKITFDLVRPNILPTINWEIDISWRHEDYSILIEIPQNWDIYYNVFINDKNYGWNYDEDIFIHTLTRKFWNV